MLKGFNPSFLAQGFYIEKMMKWILLDLLSFTQCRSGVWVLTISATGLECSATQKFVQFQIWPEWFARLCSLWLWKKKKKGWAHLLPFYGLSALQSHWQIDGPHWTQTAFCMHVCNDMPSCQLGCKGWCGVPTNVYINNFKVQRLLMAVVVLLLFWQHLKICWYFFYS